MTIFDFTRVEALIVNLKPMVATKGSITTYKVRLNSGYEFDVEAEVAEKVNEYLQVKNKITLIETTVNKH